MKTRLIPLAVVTVLSIIAGWLIYIFQLRMRGPFHWDETLHALNGLLLAYDMQQGDLLALLFDAYRQVLYPPLNAWFIALITLVIEPSYSTTALFSLLCFVLTAPLLYLAGLQLREEGGEITGIVAAVLFLASPMLVRYATQTMLEVPGLFALTLGILIYLKLARDDAPPAETMLLSGAIVLAYFVRLHYGVLLFLVVMLSQLVEAKFNPVALVNKRNLYFFVPLVLVFGAWFAYWPKLPATLGWLVNYANVDDPYSLQGWLFYPLATIDMAGSMWLFGLLGISLLLSIPWVHRNPGIRFLVIFVIVQMLLGLLHHNKQVRYIFPILPPLFLLSGFMLAEVWQRAGRIRNPALVWLPRVLVVVVLAHSVQLFAQTLGQTPIGREASDESARTVTELVRQTGNALLISTMDVGNPSPPMLDWHLINQAKLMTVAQAGSRAQFEEEQKILGLVERVPIPESLKALVRPVLTRSLQPGYTRSLYLGLPLRASYSQSQQNFDRFFKELYANDTFDGVIVVTSTRDGSTYPLTYVEPSLLAVGLQPVSHQTLNNDSVNVDIFR